MKKVFAILMALVLVLGGTALAETELSYEGKVVAGETIPVAAPFGGRMGEVPLHKGDPVQEGDTLATIKTTLNYAPVEGTGMVTKLSETGYTIEVTGGEFYLDEKVYVYRDEKYSKEKRIGKGTVKRAAAVPVKGAGSVLRLHVKSGDFVERGELLFETVEGVLDGYYAPDNTVKSPVTGVIESVEKNPGDTAAKGDTLVKIAPTKSFQVEFDVPEEDLFLLEEGAPVEMELRWDSSSEKLYTGKIVSISRMNEDPKEGTDKKVYKAYASFEPDERIRLGMSMLMFVHDGSSARSYSGMNLRTILQRASAIGIMVMLVLHIKSFDILHAGTPGLIAAEIIQLLFFACVFTHIGTSFSNAFVTLGLLGDMDRKKKIDHAVYVICAVLWAVAVFVVGKTYIALSAMS